MLTQCLRRPLVGWTWAALLVCALARAEPIAPMPAPFDSVMAPIIRIDWDSPLNPRYVNLDHDQFLFDTQQGIKVFDASTNTLADPTFAGAMGAVRMEKLDYGLRNWARLGDSPVGTVLVSVGNRRAAHVLIWWNGETRQFAAMLPLDNELDTPGLLRLGPRHVLLCTYGKLSAVVRLQQARGTASLEFVSAEDAEARQVLQATGVVGAVRGFGTLTDSNTARPVYYDVSHCGWEMRDPPDSLKRFLDKTTRTQTPQIKPYFLADGRILIGEASYFEGQAWKDLNPPLLWEPNSGRWIAIESTRGSGGQINRVGQDEPVMSLAFQSRFVEFLDARTMRWSRAVERLPDGYDANVEPLSSGNALVLMRETHQSARGVVGQVTPMLAATLPPGQLATFRPRYEDQVILTGGGVMLIGDGDRWHPSTRVEVIDSTRGQSRLLLSIPTPQVSPVGVELHDGTVVVFGGLPARCGPGDYARCADRNGQASYRYFAMEDRWALLPALRIPFSPGAWWQTGNSDLSSQWARHDAIARTNGPLAWLEGGNAFDRDGDAELPHTSQLMTWTPTAPDSAGRAVARLRKARTLATMIELDDGRLAVIGGLAQRELVALEKDCLDCPDEFVSIGPFDPARSTEVLDESDAAHPVWRTGPLANHGGGRALKLANGRIFKLSLAGVFDTDGYRAEVADAAFTRWEKLAPVPMASATVESVSAIDNRILILTNKKATVVWDDDQGKWLVWSQWPGSNGDESPIAIVPAADGARALIRYASSFVIAPWPTGALPDPAPRVEPGPR